MRSDTVGVPQEIACGPLLFVVILRISKTTRFLLNKIYVHYIKKIYVINNYVSIIFYFYYKKSKYINCSLTVSKSAE